MNIYEKLNELQQVYKAPKSEYNSHGGFKYRTLEKMLEALKPLLVEHKCMVMFNDRLENCADTPHIVAEAVLVDLEADNASITVTASAQEAAVQKGMQAAQISGSTSSYARKYALSALLLVDESEELDSKQGDQKDYDAEIKQAKTLAQLVKIHNGMNASERKEYTDKLSVKRKDIEDAKSL